MKDIIRKHINDYYSLGWIALPVRVELNKETGNKEYKNGLLSWKGKKKRRFTREFSIKQLDFLGDRANGIVVFTGHNSNLLVLDIDTNTPKETLEEMGLILPENTVCAKTPSGGMHFYFKHPEKLSKTTLNKLLDKPIDIRGAKGMITAPPTTIDEYGQYEWVVSPQNSSINEPPKELVKMIRRHKNKKVPTLKTKSVNNREITPIKLLNQISEDQKRILDDRLNESMNAPNGKRHRKDFKLVDWIVRIGLEKNAGWDIVKNIGKFKEQGRAYYDTTYKNILKIQKNTKT